MLAAIANITKNVDRLAIFAIAVSINSLHL